jgi:hypothetical protein
MRCHAAEASTLKIRARGVVDAFQLGRQRTDHANLLTLCRYGDAVFGVLISKLTLSEVLNPRESAVFVDAAAKTRRQDLGWHRDCT